MFSVCGPSTSPKTSVCRPLISQPSAVAVEVFQQCERVYALVRSAREVSGQVRNCRVLCLLRPRVSLFCPQSSIGDTTACRYFAHRRAHAPNPSTDIGLSLGTPAGTKLQWKQQMKQRLVHHKISHLSSEHVLLLAFDMGSVCLFCLPLTSVA
jgi:hypothetical protein